MRRAVVVVLTMAAAIAQFAGSAGAAETPPGPRSIDPACNADYEDGFSDVTAANNHESAVDCIVEWKITTGVSNGMYDPSGDVTRGQMASFIARYIERSGGSLPSDPPDAFGDDDGTTHEDNINKLADLGIVAGRADGTFAPHGPVPRSQMATFIIRALEHRSGGPVGDGQTPPDYFSDDDGDTHEANINKAAMVGITGGSGDGYDPQRRVRRDQMASFIARSLAELVEEDPTPPQPPETEPCQYDPELEPTDPRCRPCEWNPDIGATDPACEPGPPRLRLL